MAYLGNKPVNNFVSFAKQDITGNGGTSYSLDYPVTGANDIELYINNVRQEPTEAYSCSGSTLTLTGAVSSTDDVYVIFRGRALQTAQHPSDSALEASQATISGAATISGTTTINGLTTISGSTASNAGHMLKLEETNGGDNFIIYTMSGGSEFAVGPDSTTPTRWDIWGKPSGGGYSRGFSVDTDGLITTPQQPAFKSYFSTMPVSTNYTKINSWQTTPINRGNCWNQSTGTFTAPTSGIYVFNFSALRIDSLGDNLRAQIFVNGTAINQEFRTTERYPGYNQTATLVVMVELSPNDAVDVRMRYDQSASGDMTYDDAGQGYYNYMIGYLLG